MSAAVSMPEELTTREKILTPAGVSAACPTSEKRQRAEACASSVAPGSPETST